MKGQEDTLLLLLLCVQRFSSNLLLLSCYCLHAGESV